MIRFWEVEKLKQLDKVISLCQKTFPTRTPHLYCYISVSKIQAPLILIYAYYKGLLPWGMVYMRKNYGPHSREKKKTEKSDINARRHNAASLQLQLNLLLINLWPYSYKTFFGIQFGVVCSLFSTNQHLSINHCKENDQVMERDVFYGAFKFTRIIQIDTQNMKDHTIKRQLRLNSIQNVGAPPLEKKKASALC